jgi:hypothetical protein
MTAQHGGCFTVFWETYYWQILLTVEHALISYLLTNLCTADLLAFLHLNFDQDSHWITNSLMKHFHCEHILLYFLCHLNYGSSMILPSGATHSPETTDCYWPQTPNPKQFKPIIFYLMWTKRVHLRHQGDYAGRMHSKYAWILAHTLN